MAVNPNDDIKFSEVLNEIYLSPDTNSKKLILDAHGNATGTFDATKNTLGSTKTLLDFRNYQHSTSNLIFHFDASNTASYPGSGTTWFDLTDNSIDGTMDGGVTYSSEYGGVMSFNGLSNAKVDISHALLAVGTGDFTLEAWAKETTATTYCGLYASSGSGSGYSSQYGLFACEDKSWVGYSSQAHTVSGGWPVGSWFHYVFRRTAGVLEVFINGTSIGTHTEAGIFDLTNFTASIGSRYVNNHSWTFNGYIGMMKFYSSALTNTEISDNYANEGARFVETADTTGPTIGTLSHSSTAETSITLSWTAASDPSGIANYGFEYKETSSGTWIVVSNTFGSNVSSYQKTGLSAGTSYDFRIRAKDNAGNWSGYSNVVTRTTSEAADIDGPTIGTLSVNSFDADSVSLSWTAASDPSGIANYGFEYKASSSGSWIVVSNTFGSGVTSYTKGSLSNATSYDFRIRAKDNAGNWSGYSNVVTQSTSAPPDTTSPTFLNNGFNTGVYISDETTSTIMCHWSVSDDVAISYHRVYYRIAGGSWTYDTYNQVNGNNDYDYQITGLNASTNYEVYIRSYDTSNNYTDSSMDSTTTTANPVTQGLIVHLDFKEVNSYDPNQNENYSADGHLVQDLSGNNNNFAIVGNENPGDIYDNPNYNSGGWIDLDDNCRISRHTNLTPNTTCTVVMWISTTDIQALFASDDGGKYIGAYRSGNKEYYGSAGSPDYYQDTIDKSNIYDNIRDGNWHMVEFKNVNLSSWTAFFFNYYGGYTFGSGSKIAKLMIYDRNLTAQESLDNFNADKDRFGISLPPYITINPTSSNGVYTATSVNTNVSANVPWQITNLPTWMSTPLGSTGSGDGVANVALDENTGSTTRNGTAIISATDGSGVSASWSISQDGAPDIDVSPNPYNIGAGSTTITVSVTADENWGIGQYDPAVTPLGETSTGGFNADVDLRVSTNPDTVARTLIVRFELDSDPNTNVDLVINQDGDAGGGGSSTS
jgi:hypothetical protein